MTGEQLQHEEEEQQEDGDSTAVEEASELGWVPLEKFKGDPDKWVDAETFVERGKHIMPILKKNNEKLRTDLLKRDTEIGTLRNTLSTMEQSLARLETNYNEGLKRALKEQKADLRRQLIEARRDEDVDTELSIQEQLEEVDAATKAAEQTKPITVSTSSESDLGLSPEFIRWKESNPWFGEDKKKTKAVLRAAEDLRDEGETLTGAEFMELAAERAFSSTQVKSAKVEAGSPRNGATGSTVRAKGFSNLPKEAQDICMQDVETFVGPNKKFKDVKDWQAYYAKVYNGEPVS